MTHGPETDLVVLLPGKDEKAMIGGLLGRAPSLGIRPVRHEVVTHPQHDPGCYRSPEALLRLHQKRAARALVVFDHEGSGQEHRPAAEVEEEVRGRLRRAGWEDRAEVVVLQPELEVWVWSDSPVVDEALGWDGRDPPLREWLRERGFLRPGEAKPARPKEAVEAALREVRIPRSSAIYGRIAERVSVKHCTDPSFHRLKQVLLEWFPAR